MSRAKKVNELCEKHFGKLEEKKVKTDDSLNDVGEVPKNPLKDGEEDKPKKDDKKNEEDAEKKPKSDEEEDEGDDAEKFKKDDKKED